MKRRKGRVKEGEKIQFSKPRLALVSFLPVKFHRCLQNPMNSVPGSDSSI